MACVAMIVAVALLRRPRQIMNRRSALLWVWLTAAIIAPIAFDVLRGTYTSVIDRYVLAGLPAAFILLALCVAEIPVRTGIVGGCAILILWTIGDRRIFLNQSRDSESYREAAHQIDSDSPHPDLVIVHSIPSGVLGIARYMGSEIPIFSWVGQLRVRSIPGDVARVTVGIRKVMFVKIHQVGEPAPEEEWLSGHGRGARTDYKDNPPIEVFELAPTDQGARGGTGPSTR
jgi:hypothetical protein